MEVYASSRAAELDLTPWTAEQRQAFVDMQFRAQRADYTRRFPASEHSVILDGPTPVGRLWVTADEQELRLLDVTILPEHQGRGIGSTLLRALQDRARCAGIPLRHTVLTTNLAALRLYERVGFTVVDSTETHHLMQWVAG